MIDKELLEKKLMETLGEVVSIQLEWDIECNSKIILIENTVRDFIDWTDEHCKEKLEAYELPIERSREMVSH